MKADLQLNKKCRLLIGYFLILLSITACSTHPQVTRDPAIVDEVHLATPEASELINYLQPRLDAHPDKTGVVPLSDGVDAFVARLELIRHASSSIDLQYYIFHPDDTGKMLVYELLAAAERGVKVRMLLDDTSSEEVQSGLVSLTNHPNIDVRLYNPAGSRTFSNLAWAFGFSRLNYRMHNKSLTVDNTVSVVGGRNIGDEYFSANDQVEFGDFDLLTVGKAVPDISTEFDVYWNATLTIPLEQLLSTKLTDEALKKASEDLKKDQAEIVTNPYFSKLNESQFFELMKTNQLSWYWGDATVLYDPPNKANVTDADTLLLANIGEFLSEAKDKVLIVSPYFIPTDAGADALVNAVKNGIDVTVITNSLGATDVVAVHAGYKQYRKQLLKGGVKLYEVKSNPLYKPSSWKGSSRTSLHAKTFVLDDNKVFVGSFNLDPRSAWINTEMGILLEQPELVADIYSKIKPALITSTYRLEMEDDYIVWYDDKSGEKFSSEPESGFWRNFTADIIGIFPIESQL